jgi:hypothetical protein
VIVARKSSRPRALVVGKTRTAVGNIEAAIMPA